VLRVLVVDDDAATRALLRTLLSSEPEIEVIAEADNGHAAIDAWHEHHPDLIVLDEMMPVMAGLDAAEAILAEEPQQKIIMLTGDLSSELAARANRIGVRACFRKPEWDVAVNLAAMFARDGDA
jgi:two-component system response regulator DesR